jgi:SAM-dependent methyltransferase
LRNRDPIAAVLAETLPSRGLVLEVASGTGEHAAYFAELFPDLEWQPSDSDADSLRWIGSRCRESGLTNLREPLLIDASSDGWPIEAADALLCTNMVHISPWAATQGLMRGAASILPAGAPLILYGPYRRAEVPTAPSNEAFDLSLRERDPSWGLRDVAAVSAEANANGLAFERLFEMPANNLIMSFRRA